MGDVIKLARTGDEGSVTQAALAVGCDVPKTMTDKPHASSETPRLADNRIADLVRAHYQRIWRFVRHLGIRPEDADDVVQQVFLILSRRITTIRPESERSFLFQTALRVASTQHRTHRRRREATPSDAADGWEFEDTSPFADQLLELHRARAQLDEILESMPTDLRAVFVLFELEEETMAQIAVTLDIPPGTVASRLRRARRLFYDSVTKTVLVDGGAL